MPSHGERIGRRSLLTGALSAGSAAALVGSAAARAASPDAVEAAPAGPRTLKAPEGAVWTSDTAGTRVFGYADRHSIASGESFAIMLSTRPGIGRAEGELEIYRIGHYPDADHKLADHKQADRKLMARAPTSVEEEEVEPTAASLGLQWPTAATLSDTAAWPSGFYVADFVHGADRHRDANVAFMVVTNPSKSGDILVWLSTNTYQAYNEWGGSSLYTSSYIGDHAQMVAFNRPTPADFFKYEYFFVRWLEELASERGWHVDYASNFDMHRDPGFADKYTLLVSGSHNEYWSLEEFDAVHRRIFELGRNVLFLGANSAYWQVRYADLDNPPGAPPRGRQLVCWKSGYDPIRLRVPEQDAMRLITARFRDYARLPETMLAGVAYQSYFPAGSVATYPYRVHDVDFPFFAGTGYSVGDAVADVVGYEWDNRDPDGDGKRLWDPAKSQIAALDPAAVRVVLTGSPIDIDGKPGLAESVYFVSPAGARVFSTGSIHWAWGLGKPGFAQEKFKLLNRNLLLHLLGAA